MTGDPLTIGKHTFHSRLFVGTGKYKSFEQNAAAVEASGAEIVTFAVKENVRPHTAIGFLYTLAPVIWVAEEATATAGGMP